MESVETVVVGAGSVGLAIARRLALAGREVVVLERDETFGTGISARNSEVVHAGIYYPQGSLKARLCVAGRRALYRYCDERGLPYARLGKLIVACDDSEIPVLRQLHQRAEGNGVEELVWLDGPAARRLEPAGHFTAALLSPVTGILDSHAFNLSLIGEAEAAGAMIAYRSPLLGARVTADGLELRVGGEAPMALRCRQLINSAGLAAVEVASAIAGLAERFVPPLRLAKGTYFALIGRSPFRRLIYPVPVPGGLGIHLTMDLAGQARFGPDVQWIDHLDFDPDPARAAAFYPAIRRYWPDLPDGALRPDYAGIRPKLHGPGEAAADFRIQGPHDHRVPGLVNLYGIESPGLTSSIAIADYVGQMLGLNARLDGAD